MKAKTTCGGSVGHTPKTGISARRLKAGQAVTYHGQVYVVVGKRPYLRRDGVLTSLLVLGARCAVCGDWFEFSVAARSRLIGLNRRCATHKAPGRRVQTPFSMGVFG